jgi:hypothetical protein
MRIGSPNGIAVAGASGHIQVTVPEHSHQGTLSL